MAEETKTNNDEHHRTATAAPMMMSASTADAVTTTAARTSTKKELVIESGDCKGSVEVGPHDTLADVRVLVHEEFDDEMLPNGAMMNGNDANASDAARDAFYFCVDGIRVSRKQELRKLAWDCVGEAVRIKNTTASITSTSSIQDQRRVLSEYEESRKPKVAWKPPLSETALHDFLSRLADLHTPYFSHHGQLTTQEPYCPLPIDIEKSAHLKECNIGAALELLHDHQYSAHLLHVLVLLLDSLGSVLPKNLTRSSWSH
jgi:hypothetical protein